MVGAQANKLPTQTLENAFKGNDKLKEIVDHFKHHESLSEESLNLNQRRKSKQYKQKEGLEIF